MPRSKVFKLPIPARTRSQIKSDVKTPPRASVREQAPPSLSFHLPVSYSGPLDESDLTVCYTPRPSEADLTACASIPFSFSAKSVHPSMAVAVPELPEIPDWCCEPDMQDRKPAAAMNTYTLDTPQSDYLSIADHHPHSLCCQDVALGLWTVDLFPNHSPQLPCWDAMRKQSVPPSIQTGVQRESKARQRIRRSYSLDLSSRRCSEEALSPDFALGLGLGSPFSPSPLFSAEQLASILSVPDSVYPRFNEASGLVVSSLDSTPPLSLPSHPNLHLPPIPFRLRDDEVLAACAPPHDYVLYPFHDSYAASYPDSPSDSDDVRSLEQPFPSSASIWVFDAYPTPGLPSSASWPLSALRNHPAKQLRFASAQGEEMTGKPKWSLAEEITISRGVLEPGGREQKWEDEEVMGARLERKECGEGLSLRMTMKACITWADPDRDYACMVFFINDNLHEDSARGGDKNYANDSQAFDNPWLTICLQERFDCPRQKIQRREKSAWDQKVEEKGQGNNKLQFKMLTMHGLGGSRCQRIVQTKARSYIGHDLGFLPHKITKGHGSEAVVPMTEAVVRERYQSTGHSARGKEGRKDQRVEVKKLSSNGKGKKKRREDAHSILGTGQTLAVNVQGGLFMRSCDNKCDTQSCLLLGKGISKWAQEEQAVEAESEREADSRAM
ncbi:hypothetical protein C8J57DRAFT_1458025 [Mycena rebaudengoi]|nr:hypothetical protein C8J57DRAFT_1458025 [Mycena rebaudengoi]